jgi:hypothetical protein
MLRNLILLAILAFAVPTVPQQQKPTGQQDARKSQRDAKQADVPTAPISNNQATSYYEQPRENKPQGWHKLVAWPEGITAWAIMLTLGAIIWQALETRKAAIAARDSIKLQETAYYQWVEIVNWSSSLNGRSKPPQLGISVEVMNSTDFPIRLSVTLRYRLSSNLRKLYTRPPETDSFHQRHL